MPQLLLLLSPAANRVYAGSAARLAAAELSVCTGMPVHTERLAGVDYLGLETPGDRIDEQLLGTLAEQSAALALFATEGDLLSPVELPGIAQLDEDLLTIPKYQGKTNEQFTELLLNATLSQVECPAPTEQHPWTVLDPLCGRGTTLAVALRRGLDACGVEADTKAVEAMASFWKTWLRRKRIKHSAEVTPVRREGRSLGKKLQVSAPLASGRRAELTVFTGDTRNSASLFGKRRFEAIVTDAPYGVVHGSHTDVAGVSGKRDRSPAGLLRDAIPGWSKQLKPGGALGISWNTLGLAREDLAGLLSAAGLEVCSGDAWLQFSHRVDSSINRDLMVARKPID